MHSVGCRQAEPLDTLRFPDSPAGGTGPDAGAPPTEPVLRFDPQRLRPVAFVAHYAIDAGQGVTRQEELRLVWDAAGGVQRVQTITFQSPGEPRVDRRNEDLLQDGVQLSRGGDGRYWQHPDLDDWQEKLAQDLGAWDSLARALALEVRPGGQPEVTAGVPALLHRLAGERPGTSGELRFSRERGTLLAATLEATASPAGPRVRYDAVLQQVGDATLTVPRVPPGEIRSPDRLRTYARIQEHLAPFLPAAK